MAMDIAVGIHGIMGWIGPFFGFSAFLPHLPGLFATVSEAEGERKGGREERQGGGEERVADCMHVEVTCLCVFAPLSTLQHDFRGTWGREGREGGRGGGREGYRQGEIGRI